LRISTSIVLRPSRRSKSRTRRSFRGPRAAFSFCVAHAARASRSARLMIITPSAK
jgi:hypothetical protein